MLRSPGVLAFALAVTAALAGCPMPDNLPRSLSSSDRAAVYEGVYVHKRAVELYEEGRIREAIAVAEKALELIEGSLGATHIAVAVPLHSLAIFYQTGGAYEKAETLYLRVIAIHEEALGRTDLSLVLPLDELAGMLMQLGEYDKAVPLYTRALRIRNDALKGDRPEFVENLSNLALAYERQGAYSKAEPLYVRAVALAEQVMGRAHAGVARALNGLAMLYWSQGTDARAEPLLARALSIRENALAEIDRLGPHNLKDITSLFPPVFDRSTARTTSLAQALALDLYVNAISKLNSAFFQSLSNLDELYPASKPKVSSEPLLARAADVFETVRESAQSEVAQSLDNLAQVYTAAGEYKRAEPLLARALDAREKTLGSTNPHLANSLNNLAQLYQSQGEYAKAEPLLLRVLALREKALGKTHPDVARCLNNLALAYRIQGAYAKAEPLLVRAVAIFEKELGKTHPDLARSLNNLALLHHDQGAYATAEPLYLQAVEIMSRAPGGIHPDAVRYLNNLGVLYHASGAPEKAEPVMARAADLRESHLQLELARLSAPRKRALMGLVQQETESLVSLHADTAPASARAFELALTTVLRRKGLVLESLFDNQIMLRAHLTPAIQSKLDLLTRANTELSAALNAPPDLRPPAARAAAIASLRARIDALEAALNSASVAHRAQSQPVTPAKLQAWLPNGIALIELVRYHRFDPRPGRVQWQELRYVAYILQRQGTPQWVALGEAAPIDASIDAALAEMHRGSDPAAAKAALQRLDALVFAQIRGRLAGISHIIVSPDSKLNLVPFEALVDAQGRYELEQRSVSYVTSGRDLLKLAGRPTPRSPATIVAAPDYGPGKMFVQLENASAEAIEVSAHLPDARMLTGPRATKAALAAIAGPAVLHVATHGFFARDGTSAAPGRRPSVLAVLDPLERDMFVAGALVPPSVPAFADPADALDRAGLALAKANLGPEGIISAREIAGYDWWGTRLVVLSACATGVGVMPSGEGVFGLRRALTLAGAESQVVSLWNVSDSSTRALMREFYSQLVKGTGRAEALRQAKLRLLQQPKSAHPYYWAAFIPAGNWAPLDRSITTQQRRGNQKR
jgi:CHAT domain-containing protein